MDEKFKKVIEKFKEVTLKECYKIECIDGEPTILDDKIAGTPYFPIGEEYPLDKDGNPMVLLLQVNLKNIDLENYPKKGILEIFIDKDVDYPCQFKVKYFEEGLEYRNDLPEVSLDRFITTKPIKISLVKNVCNMGYSDYRFLPTMASIVNEVYGTNVTNFSELDKVLDYLGDWYEPFFNNMTIHGGNIGGHPDFTQSDPRSRIKEDLEECVFKIDSNLSKEIMIGDCGIIFGFISKENLKNCNFNEMFVDWDCC